MKCSVCSKTENMPFKCKFCKESFCSKHRLPESHSCTGLEKYADNQEQWTYEPLRTASKPQRAKKVNSKGSFLKYLPRKGTNLMIIVILIISIIGFSSGQFFSMFATVPQDIFTRPWILLTSVFLHAGFAHLFFNGYALFLFGNELESRIGKKRFLTLFFIAGSVGSVGYSLFSIFIGATNAAIGASGAVYGVFGALAVIAPEIRLLILLIPIPVSIRVAIGIFIALDFLMISVGTPIANSAHIAGLLTGIVFGLIWKSKYQQRHQRVKDFFEV